MSVPDIAKEVRVSIPHTYANTGKCVAKDGTLRWHQCRTTHSECAGRNVCVSTGHRILVSTEDDTNLSTRRWTASA
eukprot:1762776-Rhodomonas_salina.2